MNEQQEEALELALRGHSICILGLPGTGKSHITRLIAQKLKESGKQVAITASTGTACSQFQEASTLHR